jgi:hypothetical protein
MYEITSLAADFMSASSIKVLFRKYVANQIVGIASNVPVAKVTAQLWNCFSFNLSRSFNAARITLAKRAFFQITTATKINRIPIRE